MSPLPLIGRESLKAKTSMSTAKYGRDNQPKFVLKKIIIKAREEEVHEQFPSENRILRMTKTETQQVMWRSRHP